MLEVSLALFGGSVHSVLHIVSLILVRLDIVAETTPVVDIHSLGLVQYFPAQHHLRYFDTSRSNRCVPTHDILTIVSQSLQNPTSVHKLVHRSVRRFPA